MLKKFYFWFKNWFFSSFVWIWGVKLLFIPSLTLALFLPGVLFQTDVLVLGGSTSVFFLFDGISNLAKGKNAYVYNSIGSFGAIRQVEKNTFSIGFMSKIPPINLPTNMKQFQLAIDKIIIIYQLPKNCKDKSGKVSFKNDPEELKSIFQWSKEEVNWDKLRFDGIDCQGKVFRINRENGSGTRSAFEEATKLSKSKYFYEVQQKSSSAILNQVKKTPGAIAYVSHAYKQKIAAIPEVQIAEHTDFLSRPFYGLYLVENEQKLSNFFAFLQTNDVKNKIKKLGFIYKYEQK